MPLNFRKFNSVDDVTLFLKGHIIGGTDLNRTPNALYLHGKTLIFNTPGATVTFAASPTNAQVSLTLQQIKAQIEAQAAGVTAKFNKGRLELFVTAGTLINLDSAGTANGLLGFDTAADTASVVYAAPGAAAPALVSIVPDVSSNAYMVVVNDT